MRALVTGGAGFIGSTLVDRLLAEGHEVDVVDDLSKGSLANLAAARASGGHALSVHQMDVRSPAIVDLVARRRPECLFHLAAQAAVPASVDDPLFDAEVNVLGSLRVLEGARAAGTATFVYAASGGTLYGEVAAADLPVTESHEQRPTTPYGVSKRVVLDYLAFFEAAYGLRTVSLALANVYGPRQDPHGEAGVVAIFAERAVAGSPVTIYGDGEQTRDFVYVDDVVDCFVRAANGPSGLVVNVGTGVETSVNEIHRAVAKAVGHEVPARHAPARNEVRRNALDPAKAAAELGWRPWTPLAQGIAETVAYVSSTRGR